MTERFATDIGEEYVVGRDPDGDTLTFILFDNETDNVGETGDIADVTTEPDGADYERQSSTVSTAQLAGSGGGDYGIETDATFEFDVTDATTHVDSIGYLATFESEVAGDSSPTEHLIAVDALAARYDLGDAATPDKFEFLAGEVELRASGTAPEA